MRLSSIVEYSDKNNNSNYDPNEFVRALNFIDNVQWNFSQETLNDSELVFTLFTEKLNQTGFENTQINLTHIMTQDSNYVKFNIEIFNWPWASTQDRLAILFNFFLTGQTSNSDVNMIPAKSINQDNSSNDGVYIINKNNDTIGYLLSNQMAYGGLNNSKLSVVNQFTLTYSNNSAVMILNFPYFGNHLLQDPIIGSNGDTVILISQLYSILIEKSSLIVFTSFLSVIALSILLFMRRRK